MKVVTIAATFICAMTEIRRAHSSAAAGSDSLCVLGELSGKSRQNPPIPASPHQTSPETCPAPAARAFSSVRSVPAPRERSCPTPRPPPAPLNPESAAAETPSPGCHKLTLSPAHPTAARFCCLLADFVTPAPPPAPRFSFAPHKNMRLLILLARRPIKPRATATAGTKTGRYAFIRPPPLERVGHPAERNRAGSSRAGPGRGRPGSASSARGADATRGQTVSARRCLKAALPARRLRPSRRRRA